MYVVPISIIFLGSAPLQNKWGRETFKEEILKDFQVSWNGRFATLFLEAGSQSQ